MRLFLTTQKNTVCQHVEPRVGFRTESQTKKSPKALGKQGFCREYFAQIGACGLSCVFLRSCHCCAMERTAGWFPHRKPNKKEPEGSFLLGTPAGNRTRNGPLGGLTYPLEGVCNIRFLHKNRIFRGFRLKTKLFSVTFADFTASPERVAPRRVPKMAPFFQNRTKLLLRRRVARVFFCFYDRNISEVFFGRSAPAEILVAAIH